MKRIIITRILCFAIPFSFLFILYDLDYIDFLTIKDNHFNLITINSIFAGFLFSSLSLILSLGKSNAAMFLERIKELDSIYFNITTGITCSILSISFSIIQLFIKAVDFDILCFLELYFIIILIIFFVLSVLDVKFVIRLIRREIKKEVPDRAKMSVLSKIK